MTSTSCITGTGFMKCIPMTCSGRFVRAAISVIEIELVFDGEDGVRLRRCDRDRRRCLNLRSRFSVAASMMSAASRGAVERPCRWSMRAEDRVLCSAAAMRSLLDLAIEVLRDRRAAALERVAATTSIIVTSKPLCANTCAMPLPICPAPTTAMRSVMRSTPSGGDSARTGKRKQ